MKERHVIKIQDTRHCIRIHVNHFHKSFVFSGKGRRLKQAKEEAQAEIESYRNQREQQYKKYEQTVSIIFHQ